MPVKPSYRDAQLPPKPPANNTRRTSSNRTRHPTVETTSPSTPAQTPMAARTQAPRSARTQAPRSVSTVPETESTDAHRPPKTAPTHPERAPTEQDPLSQRSASPRQSVPPVLPNDSPSASLDSIGSSCLSTNDSAIDSESKHSRLFPRCCLCGQQRLILSSRGF